MSTSTNQFIRNASCPTQDTLSSRTNSLINKKRFSLSTNTLHYHFNPIINSSSTIKENKRNILQRIKTSVMKFFKHISNDKDIKQTQLEQSTFIYDSELDLSEEYLILISKYLLTTLRESKIKHLSCDNLFLPCNHIRNIARQCLIMSAEEPFGIMGAQIQIKLILSNQTIKYLRLIRINPKQKTIFEIEIHLHEDTKVFTLKRFLPDIKIFKQLKEKSSLYVSPRCLLIKNVFYKTAEPKQAILDT